MHSRFGTKEEKAPQRHNEDVEKNTSNGYVPGTNLL
jgi:hypothetical protein